MDDIPTLNYGDRLFGRRRAGAGAIGKGVLGQEVTPLKITFNGIDTKNPAERQDHLMPRWKRPASEVVPRHFRRTRNGSISPGQKCPQFHARYSGREKVLVAGCPRPRTRSSRIL